MPDLLSWRSLLVKWAGTICSVSANLTFGPEAPMVHLGACTAQLATHFVSGTSGLHGYGGQGASWALGYCSRCLTVSLCQLCSLPLGISRLVRTAVDKEVGMMAA